ncbi:MAG TPA: HAMP domain-containing sensor histidine kinase, partial [Terriglobia bacterium]|nr:HAMP domain-containing sensor histidine kinase [Terriglobia bacterium]
RFEPSAWPSGLTRLRARLKRDSALANPALRTAAFSGVWVLDESTPALIHAIVKSAAPGGLAASSAPRIMGALIVELNLQFIERVIFPTLAQRYFGSPGGFVYRVSIVRGANPASVLYQSSPASAGSLAVAGDAVVDLVPRQAIPPPSSLEEPVQSPNPRKSKRVLPQLITVPGAPGWRLIARHRSGSVEAAVLRLRWRNLTVSLGVLLLLALSVAIILVSAQRAHRLARLQMSLVANVSHDLRTPLAVIRSAAENLADGVVEGPQEVKEYGALIRHEDRKLSEMVEQILAFAAETSRYRTYEARPLDVAVAIESAIAAIRPLIESSGATVEKRLGPALPLVRADAAALGRCLQNLISNAVKYGGKTPWVGICAQVARAPGGTEVQIQVEDHGIGIEAEDLPYVFEPFYRGRSEHARQVRGTGLGLSLAREVAEAMNGRLTVKSAPGRGSCFTLHLPALPSAEPSEPSSNPAEIASLAADRLTRERD